MKKYNNIGELFRENFEEFSPEPSSEIWQNVQKEVLKPKRVHLKKLSYGLASFVVATGLIVGAICLITTEKQNDNNLIVNVDTKQNIPMIEQKNEIIVEQQNNIPKQIIVAEKQTIEEQKYTEHIELIAEKKLHNQEMSITHEELHALNSKQEVVNKDIKKNVDNEPDTKNEILIDTGKEKERNSKLKLIISKDTVVCENSTITLSIRNAKNIVWSNGKTSNDILVDIYQSQMYSVNFTNVNGKDTTAYIFVRAVPCTELTIPTAFTPNGDGLNDEFKIAASGELTSFELIICNKNKKELFRSNSIDRGWDGTYMNIEQSHGLYLYIVRYKDNFNQMIEKRGEFLLIRN